MPFTSTPELPPNPDVRIFFTGLLILDPNPDPSPNAQLGSDVNTCEVFVNRSAPDHYLSIEVRRKQAGRPDVIMMRQLEDLSFRATPPNINPLYGMFFRVTGGSHPRGVRRYDPAEQGQPSPEGEGFALAIDLQDPEFHGPGLVVDKRAGRPSILFNDAVFYTAVRTRDELAVSLRRQDEVVAERFRPFASLIGANIYLDAGGAVLMSFRQQGRDKLLRLEKPSEAGVSYEIYIANEPLYEADESPFAVHDEFGEYYRLLPDVPVRERFRLVAPPPQPGAPDIPFPDRGSTSTPCMPVVKGGSSG